MMKLQMLMMKGPVGHPRLMLLLKFNHRKRKVPDLLKFVKSAGSRCHRVYFQPTLKRTAKLRIRKNLLVSKILQLWTEIIYSHFQAIFVGQNLS